MISNFLALYEREFAAYNRVHNISRLRDLRAEAADSLRVLQVADFTGAKVADIGSGAGFPALFLAAAVPSANFVLFEPNYKKAAFLSTIIIKAGLQNARVVAKKVQDYAPGSADIAKTATAANHPLFAKLSRGDFGGCEEKSREDRTSKFIERDFSEAPSKAPARASERFDIITSRAFAPAAEVMRLCAHLCTEQTKFLLFKGSYVAAELSGLQRYFLHEFHHRTILECYKSPDQFL